MTKTPDQTVSADGAAARGSRGFTVGVGTAVVVLAVLLALSPVAVRGLLERPSVPLRRAEMGPPPERVAEWSVNARDLRWSPSGRYLAASAGDTGLHVIDVDARKEVAFVGGAATPHWSAGDRLHVHRDSGWEVWEAPFVSGGTARDISTARDAGSAPYDGSTVCLTGSGSIVSLAENAAGGWVVRIADSATSVAELTVLPSRPERYQLLAFGHLSPSPRGALVAVTFSGTPGLDGVSAQELWIVDAGGPSARFLHAGKTQSFPWPTGDQDLAAHWSADGTVIMFGGGGFDIEEIDVATGRVSVVARNMTYASNLRPSPSGRWVLVDIADNDGMGTPSRARLGCLAREGKRLVVLPSEGEAEFGDLTLRTAWHPTDDIVAIAAGLEESCTLPESDASASHGGIYLWRPDAPAAANL